MFAITGATGNTGRVVSEKLLAAGQQVRAIGRSKERLDALVKLGAEAFVADVNDPEAMTRAFSGARAVYAMLPPDFATKTMREGQDRASDSLATALERSGVTHAVCLSSVGADKSERVGPVNGLHAFEHKINGVAKLNALILRPSSFMENNFPQVKIIQSMGTMGGILKGDLPFPQIASRDIGTYAADAFIKLAFTGKFTRELLGQRDVSMNETAKVFGQAIGKPNLGYTKFPTFAVEMAMKQMGLPEDYVKELVEMLESINSGWMAPQEKRSAENTTPTSIETFATEEFAPRFQGKAAGA
jgi:uncharacterized protein YbjT (DUF2867 family)